MSRLLHTIADVADGHSRNFARNWPEDDDDPSFEGPFRLGLRDLTFLTFNSAYAINSIYRDPFPKGPLAAKAKVARDFISDVLFGVRATSSDEVRGVKMKKFEEDDIGNIDNEFRPLPLMCDTILGLNEQDYIKRRAMRKALDCIVSSINGESRKTSLAEVVSPKRRNQIYIYEPINLSVIQAWQGLKEYDTDHISTAVSSDPLRGRPAPDSGTKPVEPETDEGPDKDGVSYQQQEIDNFQSQISDDSIRFHIFPIYTPTIHGDDRWMLFIYDNRHTNRVSKHKSISGRYQGRFVHVVGYEDEDRYTWTASFARAIERTLKSIDVSAEVKEITHIYPLSDNPITYGNPACYSHTGPLIIYILTRAITLIEDVVHNNASFLRNASQFLLRPDYREALGGNGWNRMFRQHIKQLIQSSNPDDDLRGQRPNMPDSFYTMLYEFLDTDNRPAKLSRDPDNLRPYDVKNAMYENADAYLIGQYQLPDDKHDTGIRRFRGVPLSRGSVIFLKGPSESSKEYADVLERVLKLLQVRRDEMHSAYYKHGLEALKKTGRSILALYIDDNYEAWILANNCVRSSWYVNGHRASMSDFMGPLPSVTYICNDDLKSVPGKSTFKWIFLQRYDIDQAHQELASFGKAPREVLQKNFGQLWAPQDQDILRREDTHTWHHHHKPVAEDDSHLNHLWKLHTGSIVQCSNWRCYSNGLPPCQGTVGDAEHPHNELFGSFAKSEFHDCKDDCPDQAHEDEDDLILAEGVAIYEPYLRNSKHLTIQAGRFVDEGGRIEGRSKLFHPPKTFMPISFQAQDYWHGRDVKEKMANSGIRLYGDPQTGVLFDLRSISKLRIKRQRLWNSLPERRQMQIWVEDKIQSKDNRNTMIDVERAINIVGGSWNTSLGPESEMNVNFTDAVDPFFESEFGVDNVVVDPISGRVDKVYNRRKYQRDLLKKGEYFMQQDPRNKPRTLNDMEPWSMIVPYMDEDEDISTPKSADDGFEVLPQKFYTLYNEYVKKQIQRLYAWIQVEENARKDRAEKDDALHEGKPSKVLGIWKRDLHHKWNTLINAQKWTHLPKLGSPKVDAGVGTEPPADELDEAVPEEASGTLSLKRKHRHEHAILSQAPPVLDVDAEYPRSIEIRAANAILTSNREDLSEILDHSVLQSYLHKTSYYDEDFLMEPEPTSSRLPLNVVTERVVVVHWKDADTAMSTDFCHRVMENQNRIHIERAVVYPKPSDVLTLVRDVGENLPRRVNLKRQLVPDQGTLTGSSRKLIKLERG